MLFPQLGMMSLRSVPVWFFLLVRSLLNGTFLRHLSPAPQHKVTPSVSYLSVQGRPLRDGAMGGIQPFPEAVQSPLGMRLLGDTDHPRKTSMNV